MSWNDNNTVVINVEGSYELNVNWTEIENELRKDPQVITDGWGGIPYEDENFQMFLYTVRPTIECDCYGDLDYWDINDVEVKYEMIQWVLKYFFNHDNNHCNPTYTPKTREELPRIGDNVIEKVEVV